MSLSLTKCTTTVTYACLYRHNQHRHWAESQASSWAALINTGMHCMVQSTTPAPNSKSWFWVTQTAKFGAAATVNVNCQAAGSRCVKTGCNLPPSSSNDGCRWERVCQGLRPGHPSGPSQHSQQKHCHRAPVVCGQGGVGEGWWRQQQRRRRRQEFFCHREALSLSLVPALLVALLRGLLGSTFQLG